MSHPSTPLHPALCIQPLSTSHVGWRVPTSSHCPGRSSSVSSLRVMGLAAPSFGLSAQDIFLSAWKPQKRALGKRHPQGESLVGQDLHVRRGDQYARLQCAPKVPAELEGLCKKFTLHAVGRKANTWPWLRADPLGGRLADCQG